MQLIKDYKEQCESSVQKFEKKVLPIEYIKHGVLPSEAFAFCAMADLFKVDMIIESGVAGGYSTEIFARYFDIPIYSIDSAQQYGKKVFQQTRKKLQNYRNVNLVLGDSFKKIPEICKEHPNKRIALFIDGPKSWLAVQLCEMCFFKCPNIVFAAIHDIADTDKKDQMKGSVFYTDNSWFHEKYFDLNYSKETYNGPLKTQLKKYPYGFIMSFNINSSFFYLRFFRYFMYKITYLIKEFCRRPLFFLTRYKIYLSRIFNKAKKSRYS